MPEFKVAMYRGFEVIAHQGIELMNELGPEIGLDAFLRILLEAPFITASPSKITLDSWIQGKPAGSESQLCGKDFSFDTCGFIVYHHAQIHFIETATGLYWSPPSVVFDSIIAEETRKTWKRKGKKSIEDKELSRKQQAEQKDRVTDH